MKTIIRIVYMFICLLLAACCATPTGKTPEAVISSTQKASVAAKPTFPELDIWLIENKLAINVGKSEAAGFDKAFEQGIVLAYGEGYPLAEAEGAKKRLTAVRAAEVVAQRNLAEYLARNAVNGEIKFSTYNTQLEAFLKGAQVVASEYNPDLGKAAVLLKLDLGGAKGFAK
jgi:hypothetical protein